VNQNNSHTIPRVAYTMGTTELIDPGASKVVFEPGDWA